MGRGQHHLVFLVIAFALLASLPCSTVSLIPRLDEKSTDTPAGDALQIAPKIESTRDKTKPAHETTLPPVTAGSDVLDLNTGLDSLDSYRVTYEMAVVGKDENGSEIQENLRQSLEIVKSRDSLHFSMQHYYKDPTLPGHEPLEIFQIGPMNYMYMVTTVNDQTKGICKSIASDESKSFMNSMVTPDELVVAIQREKLVANGETVNGVIADHYNVKVANFGNGTASALSAEVWVAPEGGFVVRFTGTADGNFTVTGRPLEGTMNWTYNLSQIDTLEEIILPESCRQINGTT